jgi:MoxR-like ATPase
MSASLSAVSEIDTADVEMLSRLRDSVASVFHGRRELIDNLLVAVLAGGHVLIEDVPGVGKSTLAQALATALGCSFTRLQFTADLLPSDIIGVNVYDNSTSEFQFHPGPVFCNILLADEINRTPPKTQSSLLEAMNEAQVSVDGRLHPLPQPFLVLATQNPFESHGTFPLPESQVDRFLVRLQLGYPEMENERLLLREAGREAPVAERVLDPDLVVALQKRAMAVTMHAAIEDFVLAILSATRTTPGLALGASPRAGQALVAASRARAFLASRDFVAPDDVLAVVEPVLAHRLLPAPSPESGARGSRSPVAILREILASIPVPR